jgi:hypothetical protein
MDHDFRDNIRPIIPSLLAPFGQSKNNFQEIFLLLTESNWYFTTFSPVSRILYGTVHQFRKLVGWVCGRGAAPSAYHSELVLPDADIPLQLAV